MSATLQGWQWIPGPLRQTWRCELTWCVLEVTRGSGSPGSDHGELWKWTVTLRGGHRIAHGEEMDRESAMVMASATFDAECQAEGQRAVKAVRHVGRVR